MEIDTLSIEIDSQAGKAASGFDSLINKINRLGVSCDFTLNKLGKLQSALIQLQNTKSINIQQPTIQDKVPQASSSAPEINGAGADKAAGSVSKLSGAIANLKSVFGGIGKQFETPFNKIKNGTTKALSGLKGLATKGFGLLKNSANSAKNVMSKAFDGKIIKKISQMGLALIGVRGLFTGLRKAVSAYKQYDEELSDQLSNNWAVLGSLLAPAIETMINLFSKAVAYINAFVQALFGLNLVAKANAKALNKQSKSAGSLKKELAGLQSFDDLHVADFGKDSGAGKEIKPLTVEEVDITPIEKVMDELKNGNWYMTGVGIAMQLNKGFESINFDPIIQKASEFGQHFAELFNGITEGLHWDNLGSQLAKGLNVVLGFASNFITTYHFDSLGLGVATGLNNAINEINWEQIGQLAFAKIKIIQDFLFTFVQEFDFKNFGTKLGTAIKAGIALIDGKKIGQAWSGAVKGMYDTLSSMISTIPWGEIGTKIGEFILSYDWFGVIKSIINVIISAIEGMWDLIVGIGTTFGQAIADGIKDITDKIDPDILTLIKAGIAGISTALVLYNAKAILAKASTAGMTVATTAYNVAAGLATTATTLFGAAFAFLTSPITLVVLAITALIAIIVLCVRHWDDIKEAASKAWDKIKEVWGKVKDWFKEHVVDPIVEKFSNLKEKVIGVFTSAKDKVTEVWGTVKDWFKQHVTDPVVEKFTNIKDKVVGVFTTIWDKIKGIFGTVKEWFTEHVTQPITEAFNLVWDGVKGVLNVMIGGINTVIKALNKIKIKVPDWVPEFGGKQWGFNISEIPKLATGTNEIISEGIYHLHQGEAVVPKKYNPAVNDQAYADVNKDVAAKLDRLINIVENFETTNVVNVDGTPLYQGTVSYIQRQNNIYGRSII